VDGAVDANCDGVADTSEGKSIGQVRERLLKCMDTGRSKRTCKSAQ